MQTEERALGRYFVVLRIIAENTIIEGILLLLLLYKKTLHTVDVPKDIVGGMQYAGHFRSD